MESVKLVFIQQRSNSKEGVGVDLDQQEGLLLLPSVEFSHTLAVIVFPAPLVCFFSILLFELFQVYVP